MHTMHYAGMTSKYLPSFGENLKLDEHLMRLVELYMPYTFYVHVSIPYSMDPPNLSATLSTLGPQ